MATFGSIAFDVDATDSVWAPAPQRDDAGFAFYAAALLVATEAAHRGMQNAVSVVTPKRALGSMAPTAIVLAGPGPAVLTVPSVAGSNAASYAAVLVEYRATGHAFSDGLYRAEARWLLLSDLTP